MTGLEWVAGLARLNGFDEKAATEAARAALGTVDLLDAANKKIGGYSKGMRQRVKLAQAIAHDPELLILDEPLSGMDPIARRRTIRLIKDWARAGKSVLVSSHILHEIEAMTSNILLINNGRILAEGDVHQIRELIDEHPHTVHIRAARPRDAGARVPDARRRAQPHAGAGGHRHPDLEARQLLPLPDRTGGLRAGRRDHRSRRRRTTTSRPCSSTWSNERHALRPDRRPLPRRPPTPRLAARRQAPPFLSAAMRVFDLSLGQMLWSRRTIFLGAAGRLAPGARRPVPGAGVDRPGGRREDEGAAISGPTVFGGMIWLLYLRFIVPVLGIFYGTALIADEVDDKTITYLFVRPIPRSAVLVGKYLAYLVTTVFVVLPSVVILYLLVVPLGHGSLAAVVPGPAQGPRAARRWGWPPTARCSRSSGRSSSTRWSPGWCSPSAGSRSRWCCRATSAG